MKVDFVRFKASDSVELRGWLSGNPDADTAVIHMHGMSGNGYENIFLDNLREMFNRNGYVFFSIDNRGSGVMNSFWKDGEGNAWGEGTKLGGSCYEIFEESESDIQGAIDYLKSKNIKKFILMGHSVGGSKVVNFLASRKSTEVVGAILLAPTDMVGWANTDPNNSTYLDTAKKLLAERKGDKLVSIGCWLDETPISAQTYPTICEAGRAVDIYQETNSPLGKIESPMLIVYGDIDIGISRIDGSIQKWMERVNRIKHSNTQISVIEGASHSFRGHEDKVSAAVEQFIVGL